VSRPGEALPSGAPLRLAPGIHFVATPIGAARDITLRALDVLGAADVLAAEDTRTLRHLLSIHGIPLAGRPLVAFHDHSGPGALRRLLDAAQEGRTVACVSEAGTPLVADPGFELARAARAEGVPVHAVPGPSAVLAALTVAGLPTDRFLFAGFPPQSAGQRKKWLKDLAGIRATLVIFESPRRVRETLGDMVQAFGAERTVAVCRELTKKFEEVVEGPLGQVAGSVALGTPRGEYVLVVDRGRADASNGDMLAALKTARRTLTVKEAAAKVAADLGLPRRDVYQAALAMRDDP
jgi:16S rRNA (cytidine1402-2'-O)-methyltransferase